MLFFNINQRDGKLVCLFWVLLTVVFASDLVENLISQLRDLLLLIHFSRSRLLKLWHILDENACIDDKNRYELHYFKAINMLNLG